MNDGCAKAQGLLIVNLVLFSFTSLERVLQTLIFSDDRQPGIGGSQSVLGTTRSYNHDLLI